MIEYNLITFNVDHIIVNELIIFNEWMIQFPSIWLMHIFSYILMNELLWFH